MTYLSNIPVPVVFIIFLWMQMSNTQQVELEGINPNLENFKTNAGIGVRSMHVHALNCVQF